MSRSPEGSARLFEATVISHYRALPHGLSILYFDFYFITRIYFSHNFGYRRCKLSQHIHLFLSLCNRLLHSHFWAQSPCLPCFGAMRALLGEFVVPSLSAGHLTRGCRSAVAPELGLQVPPIPVAVGTSGLGWSPCCYWVATLPGHLQFNPWELVFLGVFGSSVSSAGITIYLTAWHMRELGMYAMPHLSHRNHRSWAARSWCALPPGLLLE